MTGLSPVDRSLGEDFGVGAGTSSVPLDVPLDVPVARGLLVLCGVIVGGPTDSGLCPAAIPANNPVASTTNAQRVPIQRAPAHSFFTHECFTTSSRSITTWLNPKSPN